ncbi:MAG: glutamate--tRNA ligase [Acidimicrobiales bacterium]
MTPPRVRIAPSPTGFFHVGTGRTALFNWLFSRRHGGVFILRIEDTDTQRSRPEHTEGIQGALRWLGLDWDEGPYFQSTRGELYFAAIDKLLVAGAAYACGCSAEEVNERAARRGGPPGYDGHCRDLGLVPGPGRVVRFRTPDNGGVSFTDLVRGEIHVDCSVIEDFSIRKSNGDPLFNLANVVDDAEMAITHVIRGEDHVSNTPKYLLLWEALGCGSRPSFAHLPLLLNDARKKLSKRRDKVAVEDYRDDGYLPDAFVNYLALLGWSPGGDRELLTRQEMVAEFRLEDVRSAGAIFDVRKLQSINSEYMRALPTAEFVDRAQFWLRERWESLAPLVQQRARTLAEVYAMTSFLFSPEARADPAEWDAAVARQPAFDALLAEAEARFATVQWSVEDLKAATMAAGEAVGVAQLAKAQAPIRLAITGRSVGPPLFESIHALGRDKTLARLSAARRRLSEGGGA